MKPRFTKIQRAGLCLFAGMLFIIDVIYFPNVFLGEFTLFYAAICAFHGSSALTSKFINKGKRIRKRVRK